MQPNPPNWTNHNETLFNLYILLIGISYYVYKKTLVINSINPEQDYLP